MAQSGMRAAFAAKGFRFVHLSGGRTAFARALRGVESLVVGPSESWRDFRAPRPREPVELWRGAEGGSPPEFRRVRRFPSATAFLRAMKAPAPAARPRRKAPAKRRGPR